MTPQTPEEIGLVMSDCGHKKKPLLLPCVDCFLVLQALLRQYEAEVERLKKNIWELEHPTSPDYCM